MTVANVIVPRMRSSGQFLNGDLTQSLDKVDHGVTVKLRGPGEDSVHGYHHGLGAGLGEAFLEHLGVSVSRSLKGLKQGFHVSSEVKCRFRYLGIRRTFGEELIFDPGTDHLSQLQLQVILIYVKLKKDALGWLKFSILVRLSLFEKHG